MAVQVQEGDQPDSSPRCSAIDFSLFLRNRIHNLQTLRAKMGHANFIAMDTEHGEGLSSIGLASASNLAPIELPIHPAAMTSASEQGRPTAQLIQDAPPEHKMAQSICFKVRSFQRSQPTKERVWGQPDQEIDVQDVASKVTNAVKEWNEAEPEKSLVLVTYSSREELNAISSLLPQLCHIFSAWVYLQPLVLEAYHKHQNYTRLDGLNISLRYAMKTLIFCTGYQPKDLHHAGNDALRTLAIMACLTHENVQLRRLEELEHVLRASKYRKEQNRPKGTEKSRGLLRKRPGPPSRYLHVAKVTTVLAPDSGEESRADHSPQRRSNRVRTSYIYRPCMPANPIRSGTFSHPTTPMPSAGLAEKTAITYAFLAQKSLSILSKT